MDDLVALVQRSLSDEAAAEFEERVSDQAAELTAAIDAGRFDNEDFAVGLEVELYAANEEPEPIPEEDEPEDDLEEDLGGGGDAWDGSLEPAGDEEPAEDEQPERPEPYMDPEAWEGRIAPLPEATFEGPATKELGLHNAEVNTEPDAFTATGLEVQTTSVEMRIKKARDAAEADHSDLVLDAMWTISPEGGAYDYLATVADHDGVTVAENMRKDPRYVAIDNDAVAHAGGEVRLDVPGVEQSFPTILFESLTTSIQPHLQIPTAERFPEYFNAAIRTLGPVLALTTNSPLLPPDLYTDVSNPRDLLAETHHELRVAAFEQSVNTTEHPKVRVPRDLDSTDDVVERVVADDRFAPFLREWIEDGEREGFADRYWEFDHKRGTYWRWLRCVVGGDPVDGAGDEESLRIEYRPIPTQPTEGDVIATQVLVSGLVRGLVAADHPLAELPWQDAEDAFYDAARNGLDADLAWVTRHGERTADHGVIYDEVFELARAGLSAAEIPERRIDEWLDPLERRYEVGVTPSQWKLDRTRHHLEDGLDFADAVHEMQREYYELSHETQTFVEWL